MVKEKVVLGKVVNVVGLKGELKVYNYAESVENFKNFKNLYLGRDEKSKDGWEKFEIKSFRTKGDTAIIGLVGISDRNDAERKRGFYVGVDYDDLPKLPDGVFYIRDLLGMDVLDGMGKIVGKLKDIDCSRPQKIYVVDTTNGDVMVPGVDEFIKEINIENRTIIINFIEGMLNEN